MSEFFEHDPQREQLERLTLVPPAVELLADPRRAGEFWPAEVAGNPEFQRQVQERKQLNDRLDAVQSRLSRPDVSLEQAVVSQQISEQQVADLYESLGALIRNPEYQRLALYVPFEFLPSKDGAHVSESLQAAAETFRSDYRSAWEALLVTHDVRANFVDGDVMDVEKRTGDLPRVVKAAHLIPKLVERGIISIEEVLGRLETSPDELLRENIAETLPVLVDLQLLDPQHLARLRYSRDLFVQLTLDEIEESSTERPQEVRREVVTKALIDAQLQDAFRRVDEQTYTNITPKREAWLRQDAKRRETEMMGDRVAQAIVSRRFPAAELPLIVESGDVSTQRSFVDGLRKALEELAVNDTPRAQALYHTCRESIRTLWRTGDRQVNEALSQLVFRLHGVGLLETTELRSFGLEFPVLGGPLSENLKRMRPEMLEIKQMVAAIESHPELNKMLLPVALVFGSRLKGYGSGRADIDLGVFVKPGTNVADKTAMRALIKQVFSHERVGGEAIEFWLQTVDDGLAIQEYEGYDHFVGHPSWTHVLFGAAWEGDPKTIEALRHTLLTRYFKDQPQTYFDRDARALELEEMERDTLQYRLMHKGYEKFYPSFGGMKTRHSRTIDGDSAFWDSGYRQTATKLFVSRVFLPRIEQK